MKQVIALTLLGFASFAGGQTRPPKAQPLVTLELSAEVATTDSNGYPAALRITLRNVGNLAADLPVPDVGCGNADGSLIVQTDWHSSDPGEGLGDGWGCASATSDRPTLIVRAQTQWLRLQPGEFLTFTESVRSRILSMKPGKVDYWVEYHPPQLTTNELLVLKHDGYLAPTEILKTETQAFSIQ